MSVRAIVGENLMIVTAGSRFVAVEMDIALEFILDVLEALSLVPACFDLFSKNEKY